MKIIEIGTGYTSIPANIGAATEIVVEELSKVFQKENINYEIFDIKDEKRQNTDLKIKEVNVPKFFRKKDVTLGIMHKLKRVVYSINLALVLKKEIKNSNDKLIIHFHNQYNMFFYLKLVPKKVKEKVITAYTVHNGTWNGDWNDIKDKIKKKYFQEVRCIKNADKIFVLNERTKKHFVKQFNIDSKKIIYISNGVNTDIYKPSDIDENNNIIFFQCGSVCDNKNQLDAIKMLTPYLQDNKNFKYMYVGGIIDQKYKEKIDYYIKEKNIKSQVEYLGELTPGKELAKYYSNSNAFIFPSKVEAFSLSLLEAMASGLPVIMNKKVTLELDNKLNDIILFYDNEESFSKIIKEKILDNEARHDLSNKSRKIVEEFYSWNIVAKEHLKHFEKL